MSVDTGRRMMVEHTHTEAPMVFLTATSEEGGSYEGSFPDHQRAADRALELLKLGYTVRWEAGVPDIAGRDV
jgi:hypothetical protein